MLSTSILFKKGMIVLDWVALESAHHPYCQSKDSYKVMTDNVTVLADGQSEYDAYCEECGAFLYHYSYGYYDLEEKIEEDSEEDYY